MEEGLGIFEKYLSIWVALCIFVGVAIGKTFPPPSRFFE
jgi:ACR3 family arsenite transporter